MNAQLLIFAIGAHVEFSDRPKIAALLDREATKGHGEKTLMQPMIESELFWNK